MTGSFTKKRLELTLTLGAGESGEKVGDSITLSGLRMSADIVDVVGNYQGALQLRAYGLSQSTMNRLTTIGPVAPAMRAKNAVSLRAGDENGMVSIYEGSIITAWGDYNSAPDVAFNVLAQAGAINALKPVPPTSALTESVDVAELMESLSQAMGLQFENNGVALRIPTPYLERSALAQVQVLAGAAGIDYTIDRGVLAIWTKNGARSGEVPLISAQAGMVGYPSFSSDGMLLTTLFNPLIRVGGIVHVDSSLSMAHGKWQVRRVAHSLSSEMPGGPWFTTLVGWNVK